MQQRAGLLYLSLDTKRILLIHEDQKWTVPTFARQSTLFDDSMKLFAEYTQGKIVPIELYLSEDKGFEYGTYICIVKSEFITSAARSIAWCSLDDLPKHLHTGLKITLNNQIIKTKIETILELEHESYTESS